MNESDHPKKHAKDSASARPQPRPAGVHVTAVTPVDAPKKAAGSANAVADKYTELRKLILASCPDSVERTQACIMLESSAAWAQATFLK